MLLIRHGGWKLTFQLRTKHCNMKPHQTSLGPAKGRYTQLRSSLFLPYCLVVLYFKMLRTRLTFGISSSRCSRAMRQSDSTPDAMQSTWQFATRCCCVRRSSSASRHVVPVTSIWNLRGKTGHDIIISNNRRRMSHSFHATSPITCKIAGPIKPTSQNWTGTTPLSSLSPASYCLFINHQVNI